MDEGYWTIIETIRVKEPGAYLPMYKGIIILQY